MRERSDFFSLKIFQLMCFVALRNVSTFSEAAEKLYVSQSSFSNNIQSLERELGVKLIIRGTRSFSFTEAGKTFLVKAEKIVNEYNRMIRLLQDYKKSSKDRLLILADPMSSYGYNLMLTSFKQHFPTIQTEVAEFAEESFEDILKEQQDTVGIVFSISKEAPPRTKSYTLVTDRLAAFMSEFHPLANQERLRLKDLRDEVLQIIGPRQSRFLNQFVLDQCHKAGFEPNIARLDLWYSTMLESIRGQGYPAVIPEMAARFFCKEDTRVIPLDSEEFYINILISDACTHSAALKFFEFAHTN